MKIKSWLKRILEKWFPEIKQGIPKNDNGKSASRHGNYPVCCGEHLPSDIPIRRKATN